MHWTRASLVALVVGAGALVPQMTERTDVLNLLLLVMLFITLGQSWNMLAGFAGQVNLGHAAFFGIGALVTRSLWDAGHPFVLAFAAGGIVSSLVSVVVGIPTFRLRGVYFSMGTLAMAEALRITVGNLLPRITSLPGAQIAAYDLAGRYYLCFGLAVVTTLSAYALLHSRVSLGILAVREDEDAARATGVDPLLHKMIVFAASSFFAGLAGGSFAYHQVSYYPSAPFNPTWTFDAVLITFLGGVGTVAGPAIGALFFVLVREWLAVSFVQVHQVIFGILFIVVVIAVPGGLMDLWARTERLVARVMILRSASPREL